jgi:hypothetical protein
MMADCRARFVIAASDGVLVLLISIRIDAPFGVANSPKWTKRRYEKVVAGLMFRN